MLMRLVCVAFVVAVPVVAAYFNVAADVVVVLFFVSVCRF